MQNNNIRVYCLMYTESMCVRYIEGVWEHRFDFLQHENLSFKANHRYCEYGFDLQNDQNSNYCRANKLILLVRVVE